MRVIAEEVTRKAAEEYADYLREHGFDAVSHDFRQPGTSNPDWAVDVELPASAGTHVINGFVVQVTYHEQPSKFTSWSAVIMPANQAWKKGLVCDKFLYEGWNQVGFVGAAQL